ncbi:hypothetical protein MNBD_ALPHA12-742 [hydrothermal vent metagenome]|uniref:DUF2794 domain-containing protein n=1 Tax=hydrothermal vent metagenome TaxID=652676 RepID=A0A3B0U3W3_9ZZZZ
MEQRQGEQRVKRGDKGALSLVYCNQSDRQPSPRHKPGAPRQIPPLRICFDRQELSILLNLYGRNVSQGLWHDYAMDFLKDKALFSIYKRNSQQPVVVIEKTPKTARKQGQYKVVGQQGRLLKRGHRLCQVVRVLDPGFMVVK